MKKIIAFGCILFLTIQLVNGQTDTAMYGSAQALHDKYMKNYNTQNKAGWIALAGGLGITAIGSYIYFNQAMGEGSITSIGPTLFYLGAFTTLVGVPLFISAGHNKKKAKLALKEETLTSCNRLINRSNYVSVALTIRL